MVLSCLVLAAIVSVKKALLLRIATISSTHGMKQLSGVCSLASILAVHDELLCLLCLSLAGSPPFRQSALGVYPIFFSVTPRPRCSEQQVQPKEHLSDDEKLANDLARCAAVCKDFTVSNLTFSPLTGCTDGLLCSQSRQQKAAQNALDDSLDPKEREAWEIVSRVTWGNLLPESGGIEISDTALRAISLEQLHQIVMHVTSRIEGGEQWTVTRYPHGQYVEHQITKVDEVITETTHMMIAELVSQVNLYDADKYLIRPATVDSRRSFVEARCSCLAWAFLSHLCDADNGCCLAAPRFLLFALVCSLPMPTAKFQDYLVGGPRVFPNSSYV